MTTGPYAITGWTDSAMQLSRNPYWPDELDGNIDRIEIALTDDPTGAQAAVAGGRADMARVAPENAAAARSAYPNLYHSAQGSSLTVIGFSYDRALVNTVEIRRALALAIDKAALVNQFLPDQALPAGQFTPSWVVAAPTPRPQPPALPRRRPRMKPRFPGCAGVPETLILTSGRSCGTTRASHRRAVGRCLELQPRPVEIRPVPCTLDRVGHSAYDGTGDLLAYVGATWSADYLDANA